MTSQTGLRIATIMTNTATNIKTSKRRTHLRASSLALGLMFWTSALLGQVDIPVCACSDFVFIESPADYSLVSADLLNSYPVTGGYLAFLPDDIPWPMLDIELVSPDNQTVLDVIILEVAQGPCQFACTTIAVDDSDLQFTSVCPGSPIPVSILDVDDSDQVDLDQTYLLDSDNGGFPVLFEFTGQLSASLGNTALVGDLPATLPNGDYVFMYSYSNPSLNGQLNLISASDILAISAVPSIIITGDDGFCPDDTLLLEANADDVIEWTWMIDGTPIESSDESTLSIDNGLITSGSDPVTISVTGLTSQSCPADTATLVVTAYSAPVTPLISGDLVFCENDTASFATTQVSDLDYQWSIDGVPQTGEDAGIFSPTLTSSTSIGLLVVNDDECFAAAELMVTVNEAPAFSIEGASVLCDFDSTLLVLNGLDEQSVVSWTQGGETSDSLLVTSALFGDEVMLPISATVENALTGCAATNTIDLELIRLQRPLSDTLLICGDEVIELDLADLDDFLYQGQGTPDSTSITWYTDESLIELLSDPASISDADIIHYELSRRQCAESGTVRVLLIPPPQLSLPDTAVCAGSELSLMGLVDYPDNTVFSSLGAHLTWDEQSSTLSVDSIDGQATTAFSSSMTIEIQAVADLSACATESDQFQWTIRPLPLTEFSEEEICAGDSLLIETFVEESDYTWSATIQGASDILSSEALQVLLELDDDVDEVSVILVVNNYGCEFAPDSTVLVLPSPTASFVNETICLGEAADLELGGVGPWAVFFENADSLVFAQSVATISAEELSEQSTWSISSVEGAGGCVTETTGTLSILELPSYGTLSSAACIGDSLFLDGLVNVDGISLFLNGEEVFSAQDIMGVDLDIPTVSIAAGVNTMELTLESPEGCELQESVEIETVANPSSTISGLDGDYCINDGPIELSVDILADSNIWIVDGETSFAETLVLAPSSVGMNSITLQQINNAEGLSCTSEESIELSVAGVRCALDSVFQFPGGIFLSQVEELDNGLEESWYSWTLYDGMQADSSPWNDFGIQVIPLQEADSVVFSGSYYSAGTCPCALTLITSGIEFQSESADRIIVAPNPVIAGRLQFQVPMLLHSAQVEMHVQDTSGRTVFRRQIDSPGPLLNVEMATLPAGVYSIELRGLGLSYVERFMHR